MTGVTVQIRNVAPLVRALDAIREPKLRKVTERALLKSAFLVQRIAATKKIRHGARRSPPIAGILTSRNAGAGIVGSIGVDRTRLPFAVTVGSALRYAPVHEIGGLIHRGAHSRRTRSGTTTVRAHSALYPRRPFLAPALDEASSQFPAIFATEIERAIGEAR